MKKPTPRKNKRRGRAARRTAQKVRAAAKARSEIGELTIGTFNGRTLVFDGANGVGHSKVVLKPCQALGNAII